MKKTAFIVMGILIVSFIGIKVLTSNNVTDDTIYLPNLEGQSKEAIDSVFKDYPLSVVFKEEVSLCVLEPSVFLYYEDYDAGDQVFAGEIITIVIAAPSDN